LLTDPDDVIGPKDGSSKSTTENVYVNSLNFDFENLNSNQDTQIVSGLLPDRQLEIYEPDFYISCCVRGKARLRCLNTES